LLASVKHGRASLRSRPGADWTSRLPLIAKAVASLPVQLAQLDGEGLYLTENGFPDFEALQASTRSKGSQRLYYQVFDLLSIVGP
jgi:bifunctional non-homologous end joining protein LigD